MRISFFSIVSTTWLLAAFTTEVLAAGPVYETEIAPIFRKYCAGCHNGTELEGDFSLETFGDLRRGGPHGPAFLPGDSKSSRLVRMLTGQSKPVMPPRDEPQPTAAEITLIQEWIDAGAVGPDGSDGAPLSLNVPEITPARKPRSITSVAWSPDAKLLAVARFGEVQLLDSQSRQPVSTISDLPGKVNSVKFSSDGAFLIIASGVTGLRGEATLWDVSKQAKVRDFQGHRDTLYAAVLSPDSRLLATGSYDRQVILWDVATGSPLRTLKGHNDAIYDVAFNPAGTIVASASGDQTIKLWQVSTGTRLDTLSQPLKEQFCVSFSPDGQHVVAGGVDNRLRVWKVMSDEVPQINPIQTSRFAHEGPLVQLAFSPNGKHLVTVSEDRTVKLWDATTFTQTFVYERQPDITAALAWSPAGDQFVIGRLDGTLQTYPLQQSSSSETTQSVTETVVMVPEMPLNEIAEGEENDSPATAQPIILPATVTGLIQASAGVQTDADCYQFDAQAGQKWVFEINAARSKSPLDSKVEILTAEGTPVQRLVLQAVRDSYVTFRGIDSSTRDCRVHNWEEMRLNEYLYIGGEVVKLFLAPRGPDSGFNFYPHDGARRGYFDTTPTTHAVNEPCYTVIPRKIGEPIVPNGLPLFPLYYENDDDGLRQWGSDSRLNFTVPSTGRYVIRVTDVRGFQGADYRYTLTARPARPRFEVTLQGASQTINLGSGKEFSVTAVRHDEFDGEIRVDLHHIPPGFGITSPLVIPAGHEIARGTINTLPTAQAPTAEQLQALQITATAEVDGQQVTQPVSGFTELKLAEAPKVLVHVLPMEDSASPQRSADGLPVPAEIVIQPGQTVTARVRIDRRGYEGRIQFEAINQNLPHGVIIDNIGLNGLMIVEGQTERVFYITAADWVPEQSRTFHLRSLEEGGQTSWPVILTVKHPPATASRD